MANLFRAFLFKLRHDLTFRITLIIGGALCLLLTLIYLGIDLAMRALSDDPEAYKFMFCTGQSLFISSLSPSQNFGIAIPVNLISFTVLEFNHGTIRNKIIAGNSKAKIYISLFLSGLVFTFALIILYSTLSLALGSIIGGFDINGFTLSGTCNPEFFVRLIVLSILAYILITSMTIFFATLFRSIGPCIPVVIILIMGGALLGSIFGIVDMFDDPEEMEALRNIAAFLRVVNPFHSLTAYGSSLGVGELTIKDEAFIAEIVNNVIYSTIFFVGGLLIFKKRDVK